MAKALLLIDLSKDFIDLDGALNCGEAGQAILPYCAGTIREFLAAGHVVLDARDEHDPEDFEIASGLFPPHNMRGTPGQRLADQLAAVLADFPSQWIQVSKKHYNACFRTELLDHLRRLDIDELHVMGVCTDICVRYTLGGLYEYKTVERPGLKLVVHARGVASFNPVGHEDSLRHFPQAFGVQVLP
jgi:nicotinamidase/pyrazinamidase